MATQSNIPDPSLSREFIQGLYRPELIPEKLDLNNFLVEVEEEEKIKKSLQNKLGGVNPEDVGPRGTDSFVPLTEAEALEADRQIEATLERIAQTKRKIGGLRARIDETINLTNGTRGGELSFRMNISRKPRLKRAIRKLFGIKTDTITYGMYKQMLAAKAKIEREEAENYANGFPDDEKKNRKSKKTKRNDKDSKNKKNKKKNKDRGFLRRNADQEEVDSGSQNEEMYERMFPKIGRDFVYKEDLYKMMDGLFDFLDPEGLQTVGGDTRSDSEARKRALEYKAILDSGKDGSEIYKDLIKIEDDDEEEEV